MRPYSPPAAAAGLARPTQRLRKHAEARLTINEGKPRIRHGGCEKLRSCTGARWQGDEEQPADRHGGGVNLLRSI